MRSTLLALGALASGPALGAAQSASPYVPLGHWTTPYAEHLIARRVLADPSPLTRPFRAADLVRALRAVDSLQVSAAEWRLVRRLIAELDRREEGPFGRVDGHLGVAAANYAVRAPLETRCRPAETGCLGRELDRARGFAAGGLGVTLWLGPVVAVSHPYFDTRLKRDPDYLGKKDRFIAGRNAEAYLSVQGRFGEVFFGSVDRNWGPGGVEGLLLSPAPYGYDHLGLVVGTAGLRLEGILTQLDDLPDAGGVANHRYLVAHRLVVRPPGSVVISLWEGTIVAGPGRELEPWYANILSLGLLAQYDQGTSSNNQVGADLQALLGGTRVFGQLLLDDIQIDRRSAGDREPTAYGFTLGFERGLGPAAVTAFYTRVANLAYRTPNPAETVMRRGVGLARNYSDYDQLTVRAGLVTAAGALLTPELTLLRQGEGDFRRPYPPVAAYDTTPGFLAGTVERTLRLGLDARLDRGPLGLAAEVGVHVIDNADHLAGRRDTRVLGRVGLTWRFRKESVLP